MKVEKTNGLQRITACERDRREAERREFEAAGLDLLKRLREELADAKR